MLGQVPGRKLERRPQVAELGTLSLGGDRQDAEPVTLVHSLVEPVRRMVGHQLAPVAAAPAGARRRRCTTQAPAPENKSTRAGRTTFGSWLADALTSQPSR